MRRFRFVLMALSIVLLTTSCVKPVGGSSEGDSGSSFVVTTLKGSPSLGAIPDGVTWRVADHVDFGFKACLVDTSSRQPLRKQNFEVQSPDSPSLQDVKTDTNGCFSWSEPIAYNHFAGQSGWVQIERTFVGKGTNTGASKVQILINPWAAEEKRDTEGEAVILMRPGENYQYLPKIFASKASVQALAGEMQGTAQLKVNRVKVLAIPERESGTFVSYRVSLDMDPEVHSYSASKSDMYEPIKDGRFDLQMQVMASNVGSDMEGNVLLLGGDMHSVGIAENGHLHAEFTVKQERKVNQGNLYLLLKMSPMGLNAFRTLTPFNGVYSLGPGNVLSDHSGSLASRCLESPSSCNYEKMVASASNYADLINSKYVLPMSRYLFENLKLRFISIEPGETTTQRTVIYSASTCITDTISGRPLANTPLTIHTVVKDPKTDSLDAQNEADLIAEAKKVAAEKVAADPTHKLKDPYESPWITDDSGCLKWTGKVPHQYYKPEKFIEKEVIIQKGETHHMVAGQDVVEPAFERTLNFFLNPWDDKFTFGFDSREFNKKLIKEFQNREKVESRFFLGHYDYHTVRFLYNIDQFMELEVKKWILMGLSPQVLRYSGIQNARKNIEKLRDGIYLMKVAIEKSYLDPRDNSGWILRNNKENQAQMENIGGKELGAKHFITSNSTLVRVVDGEIIYPLELTMRDLRLMRVRSNFLIQLETVDERLIQAFHVFKEAGIQGQELTKALKDLQNATDKVKDETVKNAPPLKALEGIQKDRATLQKDTGDMETARTLLENKIDAIQKGVQADIVRLRDIFKSGGKIGQLIDSRGKPTGEPFEAKKGQLQLAPYEINDSLLNNLKNVLQVNDFSKVGLPKKEEIDLDLFVDQDSGLEKRSFVGPVIFLSNAYSDSMRATDNLDEANGTPPPTSIHPEGKDALDLSLDVLRKQYEANAQAADNSALLNYRHNNAYQFNQYFNSLTHLAYKQVDDLIVDEKRFDIERKNQLVAASLPYNYVDLLERDYVSLTDQPLMRVDPACQVPLKPGEASKCLQLFKSEAEITVERAENKNTDNNPAIVDEFQHLVPTNTIPLHYRDLDCKSNDELACFKEVQHPVLKASDLDDLFHWDFYFKHGTVDHKDYAKLFFGVSQDPSRAEYESDDREPLCRLLTNKFMNELDLAKKQKRIRGYSSWGRGSTYNMVEHACQQFGVTRDLKYRVKKTGTYTFLGGLNLNFNVGLGFSFGTSRGWSGGIDLVDSVGAAASLGGTLLGKTGELASKILGNVLKPISLKYGTSMGRSEGTNVSESTYLVSQAAGFVLDLDRYERCVDIHLTSDTIKAAMSEWPIRSIEGIEPVLARGLFVCEGVDRTQRTSVPESYFYFTQHFTEGDMLDQADLYNHPWLLALRGMRDFATFVQKVELQEVENLPSFLSNSFSQKLQLKGWALLHLAGAYKGVTPTFPGFYTVLGKNEPNVDVFALDQAHSFSKSDQDALGEVNHPRLSPEHAQEKEADPGFKPAP